MLTETISGKCPCCGYDKLLQRYGSMGHYILDACANCGFTYGTNHHDGEFFGEEASIGWFKHALKMWEIEYSEEESFTHIRKKVFDQLEKIGRYDDVDETIFKYDESDIISHKEKSLPIFKIYHETP